MELCASILDVEPHLLQPLEHQIRTQLFTVISSQSAPNDLIRDLLALPASLGGLNLHNPLKSAPEQFASSLRVTAPFVEKILQQDHNLSNCPTIQQKIKSEIKSEKQIQKKTQASDILQRLPAPMQRCVHLAQEKGASTWLSSLPITRHGFSLHKSDFRNAIALRYAWPLERLPSHCSCGQIFSVDHALSCPTGGYPSIRHNEVRDLTASMLSEVCHNISIEPHLQPLSGETMSLHSANTNDHARLDIAANGFWGGRFERAFFDIRVFNPSARSNCDAPPSIHLQKT